MFLRFLATQIYELGDLFKNNSEQIGMSLGLGVEPNKYKVISYNQLTADEILKTNYSIQKLIFWDVTASMPGKTATDAPHISVYWYGPTISSDKGYVIRMKAIKIEDKYTESIRQLVTSKVGGEIIQKEGATEFKNFTMKISYSAIADLAKSVEKIGNLATEITLEFGLVTKEEKAASTLPKTKILGEKPLQE